LEAGRRNLGRAEGAQYPFELWLTDPNKPTDPGSNDDGAEDYGPRKRFPGCPEDDCYTVV